MTTVDSSKWTGRETKHSLYDLEIDLLLKNYILTLEFSDGGYIIPPKQENAQNPFSLNHENFIDPRFETTTKEDEDLYT